MTPPPSPARRLRRWLLSGALLLAAGIAVLSLWNSPWAAAPKMLWALGRMPPATELPVPVRSVTAGVIADVSERGLGGRQVWVIGPGRERYYYAHLEDWAEGLARGQVVQAGQLLGHVGDSGNAKGTPPHLHWGIYGKDGARDPLPLLR